jgi:hypothetical protein
MKIKDIEIKDIEDTLAAFQILNVEFETIREEIKSIIDNGGRDRGTQQTK